MDLVFGFPEDVLKGNVILLFADLFSKMDLAAVPESITSQRCARVFIDTICRLHVLPRELLSDRDPRLTAEIWQSVFLSLGTRLTVSIGPFRDRCSDGTHPLCPRRDTWRVRSILHESERVLGNALALHQQLGTCVNNAYTVVRK